jgi:hypothetical protein
LSDLFNPVRFKIRVLSFDRVTESLGLIIFLNENDVILVKKHKNQRVATEFLIELPSQLAGLAGSHRVFSFSVFSSTRPDFSPGSAESRIDLLSRAEF